MTPDEILKELDWDYRPNAEELELMRENVARMHRFLGTWMENKLKENEDKWES